MNKEKAQKGFLEHLKERGKKKIEQEDEFNSYPSKEGKVPYL